MTRNDWIAVACVGALFFSAVAYLLTPFLGPRDPKLVGELAINLVSAAGTLAAVVVALWVAHDGKRSERRAAEVAATLMANRVIDRVELLARPVEDANLGIRTVSKEKEQWTALYNHVLPSIKAQQVDIGHEELLALMPIADGCAVRLARVLGTRRALVNSLESMRFRIGKMDKEVDSGMLSIFLTMLKNMEEDLEAAHEALVPHVRIDAHRS